jgi:ATP-dependent helicase IRC3
VIIADEAHHAVSRTMLDCLDWFHALKDSDRRDPRVLLLGATATPSRTDCRGLEKVFSKIVFNRDIRSMISDGYLADIIVYRILTGGDISQVSTSRGDFVIGQLQQAVNTPQRNRIIVDKYKELGAGLPFLAFTVDVQHSHDLAQAFGEQGIECVALSGKTPLGQRREAIARFQRGEIAGLISCAIFREGFDAPIATVGLMAAPTQSSLTYTQEVGRLLRPYPAPEARATHRGYVKETAIVLDFCDFRGDRRVFNAATLFGLNADFDLKGRRARKVVEEIEKYETLYPSADLRSLGSMEEIEVEVQRKDPFAGLPCRKAARRLSRFAWLEETEQSYRLSIGDGSILWVEVDQLNHAKVLRSASGRKAQRTVIFECDTMEEAFAYADSQVPIERIGLALRTARWRKQEPTSRQCETLWRLDHGIRSVHSTPHDFYRYALRRYHISNKTEYSRGWISEHIDRARNLRER